MAPHVRRQPPRHSRADSSNIRVENNIVRHRRGVTNLGWSQALRLAGPSSGASCDRPPPTDTVGVVIVGNTVEELAPTGSVLASTTPWRTRMITCSLKPTATRTAPPVRC
jgi:hypothetical protein